VEGTEQALDMPEVEAEHAVHILIVLTKEWAYKEALISQE
jgi:hypothetical protein